MPTTTIVVLFNLAEGIDAGVYEDWAKSTDLPAVRGLGSVEGFEVLRASGLLMSEHEPPYEYVELIRVSDMERFGGEVSTETMQKVAGEFQSFADDPLFILTQSIEG